MPTDEATEEMKLRCKDSPSKVQALYVTSFTPRYRSRLFSSSRAKLDFAGAPRAEEGDV